MIIDYSNKENKKHIELLKVIAAGKFGEREEEKHSGVGWKWSLVLGAVFGVVGYLVSEGMKLDRLLVECLEQRGAF